MDCQYDGFEITKLGQNICKDINEQYGWCHFKHGGKDYIYKNYDVNQIMNGKPLFESYASNKDQPWFKESFGRIIDMKSTDDGLHILQEFKGYPISFMKEVIRQSGNKRIEIIYSMIKDIANYFTRGTQFYTDILRCESIYFNQEDGKVYLNCKCSPSPIETSDIQEDYNCAPEIDENSKMYKDNKSVVYSVGMAAILLCFSSAYDISKIQTKKKNEEELKKELNENQESVFFGSTHQGTLKFKDIILSMVARDPEKRISFSQIKAGLADIDVKDPTSGTVTIHKIDPKQFLMSYAQFENVHGKIKSMRNYKQKIQRVDFTDGFSILIKKYDNRDSYNKELEILNKFNWVPEKAKEHLEKVEANIDNSQILAIQYCGKTLQESLINLTVKKDKARLFLIMDIISDVLETLTLTKLFHCDIKLENITILETGSSKCVKIIDFDVSSIIDFVNDEKKSIKIDMIKGITFEYAPKELINKDNEIYPRKIDIYSLAITAILLIKNCPASNMIQYLYNTTETFAEPNKYDKFLKFLMTHSISIPVIRELVENYQSYEGVNKAMMQALVDLLINMISEKPLDRFDTETILKELKRIKNIKEDVSVAPLEKVANAFINEDLCKTVDSLYYAKYNGSVSEINDITADSRAVAITKYGMKDGKLSPESVNNVQAPSWAQFYNYVNNNKCILYSIGGAIKDGIATSKVSILCEESKGDKPALVFKEVHPMKEARVDFGITSFQHCIFVAGGRKSNFNEYELVNTVELYDTRDPQKCMKQEMKQAKYGCSVCVFRSGIEEARLFVIGGRLSPEKDIKIDTDEYGVALDFSTLVEIFSITTLSKVGEIDMKKSESSKEFLGFSSCIAAQVESNKILIFGEYCLKLDKLQEEPEKMMSTIAVPTLLEVKDLTKAKYVKCNCEDEDGFEASNCIELSSKVYILPKFHEFIDNSIICCSIYDKESITNQKFSSLFADKA